MQTSQAPIKKSNQKSQTEFKKSPLVLLIIATTLMLLGILTFVLSLKSLSTSIALFIVFILVMGLSIVLLSTSGILFIISLILSIHKYKNSQQDKRYLKIMIIDACLIAITLLVPLLIYFFR